ncbi:MAG: MOSC domain-containing protein [Anaerolineae bacterium]|nr:MOSC domain-containing protein [Anaerolineae bacterium]
MNIEGKVEQVLIAPDPERLESEACPLVEVSFSGFNGDRHSGLTMRSGGRTPYYERGTEIRNSRQVSIVSIEELIQISDAMNLPRILPEWLGANLCLSGIPRLSQLPPATRLFFESGVTLVVEGENKPCTLAGKAIEEQFPDRDKLAQLFPKAGIGLRGLVAWVEKPGFLRPGEKLTLKIPAQVVYSLPE